MTQIELKEESFKADYFNIHQIHCICSVFHVNLFFSAPVTVTVFSHLSSCSFEGSMQVAIQYFSSYILAVIKVVFFHGLYLSYPECKKKAAS